jgi:hypothetical protein
LIAELLVVEMLSELPETVNIEEFGVNSVPEV